MNSLIKAWVLIFKLSYYTSLLATMATACQWYTFWVLYPEVTELKFSNYEWGGPASSFDRLRLVDVVLEVNEIDALCARIKVGRDGLTYSYPMRSTLVSSTSQGLDLFTLSFILNLNSLTPLVREQCAHMAENSNGQYVLSRPRAPEAVLTQLLKIYLGANYE